MCYLVCVCSCGHVLSCWAINVAASRDPGADRAYPWLKAPRRGDWILEPVPGWGRRRDGQTCVDCYVYHNEGKRMCGLLPSLVLFRLVTRPLQLGVVGPYPVRGVWFSSRLQLKGNSHIQNCGP
jgi:hypothetical protein